ncbi:MAG: VWA domain-containing protein [Oligoflexia bacterium]|nr:VWA domain-containing protein [Oligoflexia bacterium]
MPRWIKHSAVILLFLGLVTTPYINCGDVKLTKMKEASVVSNSIKVEGTFCSQPPPSSTNPLSVIFIIDMSGSNINRPGQPPGTDIGGLRFTRVEEFINNCNAGSNVRYSIIPFSTNILLNDANNSRCKTFYNANQARSVVGQLRNIQNSNPSAMAYTNYQSALDCLNVLMQEDIDTLLAQSPAAAKNQFYTTYFLTDGAPTDEVGTPIPAGQIDAVAAAYAGSVRATSIFTKQAAGGFLFQSVYYGNRDFTLANRFLLPMTQAGGTAATIQATDLSSPGTLNFCQMTFEPVFVPFSVKNPFLMNYNALMKNGVLLPDSDSDGRPDSQDTTPVARRTPNTKELFEGICNLMPAGTCAAFNTSGCNNTLIDLFGFTACDRQVMSLDGKGDLDHDGMPDLAEILKGGLVSTKDDDYTAGDGLTNLQKLRKGRQLRFFEVGIDPKTEINAVFTRQNVNTICQEGTEEYKISVHNLPLVRTKAYSSANATENSYFGHGEEENLANIYFYSEPSNPELASTQIFGLKPDVVRTKMKFRFGESKHIYLDPSDFTVVGTFEE